jgi:alkanesulfonate monooxygenase SsuD/methylene tetrahydromethanopterin reductase-like flavin-dependent oxidoreductase (luciferase family)
MSANITFDNYLPRIEVARVTRRGSGNDGAVTSHPRVGCVFRPQFAPERLAGTARAADDAGLDELWLWEDCFLAGGISAAAIALSNSARLTVGVGVLPVPMRNVAATAMEIATLARAFPGRVRIGLGHGVLEWMGWIGARVESPMTLLREYVVCLSALLRGERVTFDGRYVHLEGIALDWPPETGVELLAGGVGPKTLRLTGEVADGTVITGGTTPDGLRTALGHIVDGAAGARRSIVTYLLCTTGPTAEADLRAEAEFWKLDPAGDVGVFGDAAAIATGARRWVDAGADTVVLQPTASADVEEFVRFIGAEVQPLLQR